MSINLILDPHEEWTNKFYYFGLIILTIIYIIYAVDKHNKLGEMKNGKTLTKVPPYM